MKENTQKGQRYWGAGEVDRGGGEDPCVEKRNKKNWPGSGRKRAREGNHVTPNLQKLVHQTPRCGRVLASNNNTNIVTWYLVGACCLGSMPANSLGSSHTPIQSYLSGVLPLLKVTLTRAEDSFIVDGDTLTEASASTTTHSSPPFLAYCYS